MSTYEVVLGLQSTADWASDDYIPGNWREMILRLWPNGDAPLTAMLAKLPSETTDNYIFHWFTEGLPTQGGDITDVYLDSALSSTYTEGNGIAGELVYIKMAEAVASEIRPGHIVMLRDKSQDAADVNLKCLQRVTNGASSYIVARFLEADDNGSSHEFDAILVIGSINPQASESPEAISYQPVGHYNYTQIWRTPLEIAGTVLETKTRFGPWYQHEKENALRMHSIEMEKSLLWGSRYLGVGDNGKPEYATQGIIRGTTTHRYDYKTDTDYSGKTWIQGGEDWFRNKLASIFKYGSDTRLAYGGIGAILAFNKLAENNAMITITPGQAEYGIKVMMYEFNFGRVLMKRHPLFSYETTNQYSMLLLEPKNLKLRPFKNRDTHFRPDLQLKKGGWTDKDSIKEGWLTEAGLEMHHEETFAYMSGVGQDNPL